jgi:signal transduction histidine kinase/ActR/RegA family two-component response regulator
MNDRLNLELAKEYYKLAPHASASFYALLVVVLFFFWGKIPASLLVTWAAFNFVAATAFLVAARLFQRRGKPENAARWLDIYAYLVLFQDAPWGLIGPMSFMVEEPTYRMLTLFMLGGMAAGAIVTRALVFKTYMITLFSLLTPIIITLALQRTGIAEGMLALVLIYLVFMLAVAKSYSASFNRNILFWLENSKLVEQLRSSHAEVEAANRDLTREIERRNQIEDELVEAKERSERANEAKNQFLANVSHELRTPLNGILGFAELLHDEKLEEHHQRHVGQIGKAAQSLLRIVNDILDITAIEAGHISFHDEAFSLRGEMEDLMAIFQPLAMQKDLSLQMCVEDGVEDVLCGDVYRLRQIVGNLLSNALKYTEAGHVNFAIRCMGTSEGKVALRFAIEDTGIGIASDALPRIFENFSRIENFETRRNEGAGLGLAIVKTLVQKMNGKLDVRSMPGQGSCFGFELAFACGAELPGDDRRTEVPELTPEQWQEFNVLVVDDNEINRMVLTAFLSKIGIPYEEAENGYEALNRILAGDFDVVLMDIQMPDISGIDVAKQLDMANAFTPVLIAVTAHAFPEQRQAILDAGFADMLIKPIVIGDLQRALSQAFAQNHARAMAAPRYQRI